MISIYFVQLASQDAENQKPQNSIVKIYLLEIQFFIFRENWGKKSLPVRNVTGYAKARREARRKPVDGNIIHRSSLKVAPVNSSGGRGLQGSVRNKIQAKRPRPFPVTGPDKTKYIAYEIGVDAFPLKIGIWESQSVFQYAQI